MESYYAKHRRKAFLTRVFAGIILVLAGGNLFGQLQDNQWRLGFNSAIDFNTSSPIDPTGNPFQVLSSNGTLPQSIQLLPDNSQQGAIDHKGDSCEHSVQLFNIISDEASVTSIQWNFDDPASGASNTSLQVSPQHSFSGWGSFMVSAIVNYSSGVDTAFFPVQIFSCLVADEPCATLTLDDTLNVCGNDTLQLQADLSSFSNVTGLSWAGGAGTFIPSDTVAAPRYVPTAAERAQGFVNLSLQVNAADTIAGQGGKLIAYDHIGEDLIFYISPLDGSIDTIQDNAGEDWIATGFESSTSSFYGISVPNGLGSINIQTGAATPITFGYEEDIFSGEFDNTNGILYAVGVLPSPLGDPTNQQLYSVNTSTGALTVIGNLNLLTISSGYYGFGDGINGLAFDPQANVLYGISYNGNLYRINVSDASTTLIGPTQSDCRGLAYDASTQKLWAINANATLFEIDKNTGSVLTTVPCQENFNFVTSLTFAPAANEVQEFSCTDNVHVVLSSDNFVNLGNDTLLCNSSEFTLSQPGFTQYLWQDGSESSTFEVTESGAYVLQATSNAGCVDTDTVQIQLVSPTLSASASPSTLILGDTAQLTAVSDATSYLWTPSEGLSCSNCPNPLASPTETTNYIVTVSNASGCVSSDTITLTVNIILTVNTENDVECKELFIPSIFSPNKKGPEANETFCIYSDCVEQFKLVIHNRWGEKVFESENISNCWDGFFNENEAATGVYAYNLYIRQSDGTVINKTGTITLIR